MKVAIVHDWLVIYGGAERVLEHLLDLYPQADLYSLIDFVPPEQRHFMRGKTPITSFVQKLPGARRHYRKMLPLLPFAIEQFDLSAYDLVISSSYCVAKGALTGPNQVHVSYCHSPMRYAWDHYHEYLREMNLESGPLGWFARWQLHRIRTWDVRSSNSVDQFVANSRFVARRIAKFYGRTSEIVFPPVDTGVFTLQEQKQDYYVAAGRFVPFKRLDLVAEAFAGMPDRKLVLLGDGPEMDKIRRKAGPNVEFPGFQPAKVVREYLAHAKAFIFPSEEDFGIVPVEAQACGTPVLAYGRGGALETVRSLDDPAEQTPTGLFFHEQSAQAIRDAVLRFEAQRERFDARAIGQHAQGFSIDAFKTRFQDQVDRALRRYGPAQPLHPSGAA
jgi:glycosyltransferase involved in cell wall biosynthesis